MATSSLSIKLEPTNKQQISFVKSKPQHSAAPDQHSDPSESQEVHRHRHTGLEYCFGMSGTAVNQEWDEGGGRGRTIKQVAADIVVSTATASVEAPPGGLN